MELQLHFRKLLPLFLLLIFVCCKIIIDEIRKMCKRLEAELKRQTQNFGM